MYFNFGKKSYMYLRNLVNAPILMKLFVPKGILNNQMIRKKTTTIKPIIFKVIIRLVIYAALNYFFIKSVHCKSSEVWSTCLQDQRLIYSYCSPSYAIIKYMCVYILYDFSGIYQ